MSYTKPVYTKTGDTGLTSLASGGRVSKTDGVFEILGDLDELNCMIGLVVCDATLDTSEELKEWKLFLRGIQRTIMDISSRVAYTQTEDIFERQRSDVKEKMASFDATLAVILEEEIDRMSISLSPLRNFILPGTSKGNSYIHLCRCITRRVERRAWRMSDRIEQNVLIYLNRLSDYFFTLARYYSYLSGEKEEVYKPV